VSNYCALTKVFLLPRIQLCSLRLLKWLLLPFDYTGQQKNTFCIKREYDITFIDNIWVLIPNLAFIFLWHITFWSYNERIFLVYKQFYATILVLAFISK